jgi:hypothetical protein
MWAFLESLPSLNSATICAWIVGLLLLVAGAGKIVTIREFRKLLAAYDILPPRAVPTCSLLVPSSELLVAMALLSGRHQLIAGCAAACLFFVFDGGIAVNLLRGRRELPCGCFGKRSDPISWYLVTRNLALGAIALASTGGFRLVTAVLLAVYGLTALSRWVRRSTRPLAQTSAGLEPR